MSTQVQAVRPIKGAGDQRWFEDLPERLSEAVDAYNLPNTDDWAPLAELSGATQFEGIDAYGDLTVAEGKHLVAPGSVQVRLVYDPNSDEPVGFSDSYPIRVVFDVELQ